MINSWKHVLTVTLTLLLLTAIPARATDDYKKRSPGELDTLVGPIALYPDVLLAAFLPAATFMDQIVQANDLINVQKKGDDAIDSQTWDATVKSVAHYPELLTVMTSNMDWTNELGDVFMHQQKDLMDSVQQLRVKAKANGALKDTKEQKVVIEKET